MTERERRATPPIRWDSLDHCAICETRLLWNDKQAGSGMCVSCDEQFRRERLSRRSSSVVEPPLPSCALEALDLAHRLALTLTFVFNAVWSGFM